MLRKKTKHKFFNSLLALVFLFVNFSYGIVVKQNYLRTPGGESSEKLIEKGLEHKTNSVIIDFCSVLAKSLKTPAEENINRVEKAFDKLDKALIEKGTKAGPIKEEIERLLSYDGKGMKDVALYLCDSSFARLVVILIDGKIKLTLSPDSLDEAKGK